MRMHSRPSTRKAPARASSGSLFTAALPFLLAATGMLLVGTALILEVGLLVLAGAGIVVIAAAMYFIAASLDRADQRRSRSKSDPRAKTNDRDLPGRGPLADAAVDALTRTNGPGGVWPPLSGKKDPEPTQEPASTSRRSAPPASAGASRSVSQSDRNVPMWDPHGHVAPDSFQDPHPDRQSPSPASWPGEHPEPRSRAPAHGDPEALLEFQPAGSPETAPGRRQESAPSSSSPEWDPGPDPSDPRDLRVWPGASDLGSWQHLSRDTQEQQRVSERRRAASMKERRDRLAERLPTVGAILASPEKDETPPKSGATRGKCSSCQNYLWAPPQRPITLKCPSCGHKARLY